MLHSAKLSGWDIPYSTWGMDAWSGCEVRLDSMVGQWGMVVEGLIVECGRPIASRRGMLLLLLLEAMAFHVQHT